jgi:hypothetical protein
LTKITLQSIVDHEKKAKSLQGKLLLQFDDEIHSLQKDGFDRLLCVSRYAEVFGRLWQFFTRQALAMKEMSSMFGCNVEVDTDVPIEKLQELIAVPIKPRSDPRLNTERPVPEVVLPVDEEEVEEDR